MLVPDVHKVEIQGEFDSSYSRHISHGLDQLFVGKFPAINRHVPAEEEVGPVWCKGKVVHSKEKEKDQLSGFHEID